MIGGCLCQHCCRQMQFLSAIEMGSLTSEPGFLAHKWGCSMPESPLKWILGTLTEVLLRLAQQQTSRGCLREQRDGSSQLVGAIAGLHVLHSSRGQRMEVKSGGTGGVGADRPLVAWLFLNGTEIEERRIGWAPPPAYSWAPTKKDRYSQRARGTSPAATGVAAIRPREGSFCAPHR